jgi:hypothetical protein
MTPVVYGLVFVVIIAAVLIGVAIGAVLLRAAIALYNKMAGGASKPNSVPEPDFGKAMWIIFAVGLINVIAGVGIDQVILARMGDTTSEKDVVGMLISIPVHLLIMAVVLTQRLPTAFARAILVTLCYMLISVFVVVLIGGIVLALFLAIG